MSQYTTASALGIQVRRQSAKFQDTVIDCAARNWDALRMSLVLADTALVPVQPRGLDVWVLGAMTALVEPANEAKGGLQARAVLNLADLGTSPDNADAEAAMANFPALTLIGAPIRRRKAFASAAAHALLVDELSHVDMTPVQELSALTRWCLAMKVISRQYEHHQKTISASNLVASAPDAKPRAMRRGSDRRVQITVTSPREMMNRLDPLAEQTGQTRAGCCWARPGCCGRGSDAGC